MCLLLQVLLPKIYLGGVCSTLFSVFFVFVCCLGCRCDTMSAIIVVHFSTHFLYFFTSFWGYFDHFVVISVPCVTPGSQNGPRLDFLRFGVSSGDPRGALWRAFSVLLVAPEKQNLIFSGFPEQNICILSHLVFGVAFS